MSRLLQEIELDRKHRKYLHTIAGHGYKLTP